MAHVLLECLAVLQTWRHAALVVMAYSTWQCFWFVPWPNIFDWLYESEDGTLFYFFFALRLWGRFSRRWSLWSKSSSW